MLSHCALMPRPRRTLAALPLLAALSLCAAGCALPPLDAARLSLGAVVAAYDAAEPRLEAARAAEGAACLPPAAVAPADPQPCLAAVRARWAPVRAASEAAWRAIVAAVALLHLSEATAALGGGVDGARVAAAVGAAVDAVGAMVGLAAPATGGKSASGGAGGGK